jgi:hypothetical protein
MVKIISACCQQTELILKPSGRNGLLGPDWFTKELWLEIVVTLWLEIVVTFLFMTFVYSSTCYWFYVFWKCSAYSISFLKYGNCTQFQNFVHFPENIQGHIT